MAVMKQSYRYQPLALLGISLATLLVLLGTSALTHLQGFLPLPVSAHTTIVHPTCASSKGTQEALCEQQNPAVQGCEQDARPLEAVSVFTEENSLIGEADMEHSFICKTYWVRIIAFEKRRQVQSIEAVISFHTGQKEDRKKTVPSSGEQVTVVTDMIFVQSLSTLQNWKGVFRIKRQEQPVVIPLTNAFSSLKDLSLRAGERTVVPPQLPMACASDATEVHCTGQNPVIQGCVHDARTIASSNYWSDMGELLVTVERRYSPICHSEWGRIVQPVSKHRFLGIRIAGSREQGTVGPLIFTTMLFVPNLSRAFPIVGSFSLENTPDQEAPGEDFVLSDLPAA